MHKSRRKRSIVIGLVAALAVAGAAIAYWTQTGSGTGSAATGTGVAVTVTQTTVVTGLYPGATATPIAGKFNNTNSGPAYVNDVSATISGVTGPNIDGTHPCTADDYQLNGFPVSVDAQIPVGSAQGNWSGASIQLLNTASNQDGCKGATVALSYTSD